MSKCRSEPLTLCYQANTLIAIIIANIKRAFLTRDQYLPYPFHRMSPKTRPLDKHPVMLGLDLYPVLTLFVGPSRLRGVCSGSEAGILPLALTRC